MRLQSQWVRQLDDKHLQDNTSARVQASPHDRAAQSCNVGSAKEWEGAKERAQHADKLDTLRATSERVYGPSATGR